MTDIVCDQCGNEGCAVREMPLIPQLGMGPVTQDLLSKRMEWIYEVRCTHCGHRQYLPHEEESDAQAGSDCL